MKPSQIFATLQKIGQSLMVPVSVLPAAGLLVAAGRVLKDVPYLGNILFSGGLAIFEQLPLIFAIGVAIGFTGGAGIAGLAAVVGYYTMTNILKVISDEQKLTLAINTGVFGGILIGLLAAQMYNRFYQIKLPAVLGFFSGKRFVPIMTAGVAFLAAVVLGFVWPPIQKGIYDFGNMVMSSELGPAFYAAGKRLLIPVGLHHVFYPPFLYEFGEFTTAAGKVVHGESARYFAGDPTAGRFMASEFPMMLFGLPAAAFAMYLAAPLSKRKLVGGVMLSAALTSIITGITEPIEFAFIFVAPVLYVLHVVLAFFSGWLTTQLGIHLGYTFSASLIDYFLGLFNAKNSQYLWFVAGPVMALLYFGSFYGLIKYFNFLTPGREVDKPEGESTGPKVTASNKAAEVLAALGGTANISALDACITRLRLSVNDPKKVSIPRLKEIGAAGVMQSGQNFQAIFGVESDLLKDEIKSLMTTGEVAPRAQKVNAAKSGTTAHGTSVMSSPGTGEIIAIKDVPDATFAEKLLGDGFAIRAKDGMIYSPVQGKVVNVFPTKHALGILTDEGLELLVHVGIDTVKMKGEGFQVWVKEGDKVKKGDKLVSYDMNLVQTKAASDISPIIITNMDQVQSLKLLKTGSVKVGDGVLEVQLK